MLEILVSKNKLVEIKNFSRILLSDKNQSSKYMAPEIGALFLSFPENIANYCRYANHLS